MINVDCSFRIQLYLSLESKGPNLYFDCQKVDAFDFVVGRYHYGHGAPPFITYPMWSSINQSTL